MPQYSTNDSDATYCSAVESIEVKVEKSKRKWNWKTKSKSLRSKAKVLPRSPGGCSHKSEDILKSFALSQNQASSLPIGKMEDDSDVVIPATQFSNQPVKRKRGRRPKPKIVSQKQPKSTQTSPKPFHLNERHVRKLSKKLKLQLAELQSMLQRLIVDSDTDESVISCSQKSVQPTRMYAQRRIDAIAKKNAEKIQKTTAVQRITAPDKSNCHQFSQKSEVGIRSKPKIYTEFIPKNTYCTESFRAHLLAQHSISRKQDHPYLTYNQPRPTVGVVTSSKPDLSIANQQPTQQTHEFTPVPPTPEYIANNPKKRQDYVFSPKTFQALTQSPPNPIKRIKINFPTLYRAPTNAKKKFVRQQSARTHKKSAWTEEWQALFADSTRNQRRKDNVLQFNHCTTTVFDDADSSNVDPHDDFFTEDSLEF